MFSNMLQLKYTSFIYGDTVSVVGGLLVWTRGGVKDLEHEKRMEVQMQFSRMQRFKGMIYLQNVTG